MALGRVVPRRRAIARLADRTGGGSLEPFMSALSTCLSQPIIIMSIYPISYR